MSKILAIYGSGGLGKEILELAKEINLIKNQWKEIIFINDFSQEKTLDINVFSFEQMIDLFDKNSLQVIVGVGNPFDRCALWNKIKKHSLNSTKLIHPDITIPQSTTISEGVIICKGAFISCEVFLEENVCIQMNSSIAHSSIIGKHSIVAPLSAISGNCKIGTQTFIGTCSAIKEKISIGCNTIVSMGSVVMQDVSDNVIVMGNPARQLLRNVDNKVFK